jgi:hypothetical protein
MFTGLTIALLSLCHPLELTLLPDVSSDKDLLEET